MKDGHDVVIIASTFDSIFDYVKDNYSYKEPTVSSFFGIRSLQLSHNPKLEEAFFEIL